MLGLFILGKIEEEHCMIEKNAEKAKGSFIGLLPLIIFLVLYVTVGLVSGSFDNIPLAIGISIACIIAFILPKKGDTTTNFNDKVTIFCKGGGENTLILMVIIYLLAGAFYGVANNMHAVDSMVNFGLSILPGRMILPGLFLIACLVSFSMGTSMGTVSALIPIGIGLASKIDVNVALVCGVVVGGAMFGDNLSFISDTTIAATRMEEVEMKDKFKANFLMVLPAVILNVIILAFIPIKLNGAETVYEYSFVNIIPYILIIVFSLMGMNVMQVMLIGIVGGVAIGLIHGDFTLLGSLKVVHTGMTWMEDMALIAVLVGGLVALMQYLGGIDWLLNVLTRKTKTRRGGELAIASLVSLLDIATTNNTISIIAAGPIARDIADDMGIDRRRAASILDLFSSAFNGLSPYAGQLLVAGAMANISPVMIIPYVWYCIMMIVFGLVFIGIGWPYNLTVKKETAVKTA
jgi:Na+/H+ antiporter NhaC